MEWIRMTEAPHKYPTLNYRALYRAAVDGKIKSRRQGSAWLLWEPELQLLEIEADAIQRGVMTPQEFDRMATGASAALAPLRENVDRWAQLLVQIEIIRRSMAADAVEAEANGLHDLALAISEAADHLRKAEVSWTGNGWRLEVPGVGAANTLPVKRQPA